MSPVSADPGEPSDRRLRFGEFEVDTAAARLLRAGVPVRLEPRTLHLLVFLLDHQGRLVTKSDLLEHVWSGAFVTDNALDRAVARLRKALDDDVRAPRFIETVPTQGYRFLAEVSSEAIEDRFPAAPAEAGAAGSSRAPSTAQTSAGAGRSKPLAFAVGAAAVALIAGVVLLGAWWRRAPADRSAPVGSDRLLARQVTSSAAFEFAPSFSPDGSALAYTSNQSGDLAIWVRSLAPGGLDRQLTEGGGARVAAWSPDGRWIAYDTYDGIWIVPATGGSPRQVVEFGASPRWSPDGSTIVFQGSLVGVDINSFPAQPPSTLWRVELDGGAPVELTRAEDPAGGHGQPTFSPDGRRIAFVTAAFGQPGELWTMSASGGGLERVLAPCQCRDVVFSLDGELLYYNDFVDSQHGLWVIDAKGERPPRRLYEAPLRFLSISPDGRRLAASRHDLDSDLWSIEVSPATGAPNGPAAPFTTQTVFRNQFPVASPDGRQIAFVVARAGNLRELWTMDADGRRPEPLASGSIGGWPGWSADGLQIYFVDGGELRRIDAATRRIETIFRTELDWQTPAVAPGGAAVAFSLVDAEGITNVWTLDAAGLRTQITRGSGKSSYPTWSPDARFLLVETDAKGERGNRCAYVAAEGGDPVTLVEGTGECYTGGWSPDGDKILVARRPAEGPEERWDVWWVSRSTRELRRLTERPPHPGREFVRYPSWSANGDRVYFELAQSSADLWLFELPSP